MFVGIQRFGITVLGSVRMIKQVHCAINCNLCFFTVINIMNFVILSEINICIGDLVVLLSIPFFGQATRHSMF